MSFVTTATRDRRPIFEISRVADLFVDTLLHYRTLGHYKLHAYLVMPDHVQLILTPQSITLEQAVGLIKNGFAYRLDTNLPVWEDGFTGYSVANMRDLELVRAYLHQLPVRTGMAAAAELYPHSSAYRQAPIAAMATSSSGVLASSDAEPGQRPSRKSAVANATSLHEVAS
ncbi:MAG: transposase [Acidobacteriaceae bacterium]|jgi:putative transposase